MQRRAEIAVSSELEASAEAVWARAIDPAGINDELRPLMRMTVPRGAKDFGLDDPEPGRIGRSWIFLFGFIPFDLVSFGSGLLLFAAVALTASIAPARRALRIDPASALRYE